MTGHPSTLGHRSRGEMGFTSGSWLALCLRSNPHRQIASDDHEHAESDHAGTLLEDPCYCDENAGCYERSSCHESGGHLPVHTDVLPIAAGSRPRFVRPRLSMNVSRNSRAVPRRPGTRF